VAVRDERAAARATSKPELMANATVDAHLVERFVSREERLCGGFLSVVRDTVGLPDGSLATREYVQHLGAVAVVPILDDGRVVMVRQWRHPLGRILLEWPAGKLDDGEPVLDCAIRELREETGYSAREWARVGVFNNAAAYSSEGIEIWFARGLVGGLQDLDEGEFVEVALCTEAEAFALAVQGGLTDMKTTLGLLCLQSWRAGAWPLNWQPAP
jgi:ADP-ribose pyrophosphatase